AGPPHRRTPTLGRGHRPVRVTRWKPLTLLIGATATALVAPAVTPTATATTPPTSAATTGPFDDTYYQDALGKSGQELKDALHQIISSGDQLSYSQVWDGLKATDEDPSNPANVILLYSGRSQSKDSNGGN